MRGTRLEREREILDLWTKMLEDRWMIGVWCCSEANIYICKINHIPKGYHVMLKITLLTKVIVSLSLPTRKDKVIYMVESCKTLMNEWMNVLMFCILRTIPTVPYNSRKIYKLPNIALNWSAYKISFICHPLATLSILILTQKLCVTYSKDLFLC